MAIAFSAGDIVTFSKLVVDIVHSLNELGGAKSEFQELLRELECLQKTLIHLDRLSNGSQQSSPRTIDSIKFAALTCRHPLQEFLNEIRKYESSLGHRATGTTFKSTIHRLQWAFGKKAPLAKIQSYLNVHIGNINMLLTLHGLEKMDFASQMTEHEHASIEKRLNDTRGLVDLVHGNVAVQTTAIHSNCRVISSLYDYLHGEYSRSFTRLFGMVTRLFSMVSQVCVSTQQIYKVILEVKSEHRELRAEFNALAAKRASLAMEEKSNAMELEVSPPQIKEGTHQGPTQVEIVGVDRATFERMFMRAHTVTMSVPCGHGEEEPGQAKAKINII